MQPTLNIVVQDHHDPSGDRFYVKTYSDNQLELFVQYDGYPPQLIQSRYFHTEPASSIGSLGITDEEAMDIWKILCEVRQNGMTRHSGCCSVTTSLTWWKRLVNWSVAKLGAERQPFKDQYNFSETWSVPIDRLAERENIERAMKRIHHLLIEESGCERCHSKQLAPDPAGYYCDSKDWRGAPLLCLECEEDN